MAINVGEAKGYLDLDINGFLTGLKTAQTEGKKTDRTFKSVGTSMKSTGDKISSVGSKMTKTFTLPMVTAITTVVKKYADLEQAVGGVETLFKESSKAVIENSETAYFRAGVSGVQYMEQVTSFSARLLQGLGGDTVEAARVADLAMVDMSDNANKFGTNIASIQDAYQGFAKQNFTMLDNLKLGYGGTASEMARLVNESGVLDKKMKVTSKNIKNVPFDVLIKAINATQVRMGIFGTTAQEATDTVSGSFGMLKGSVSDFLAGMGDADANVSRLSKNMVESFRSFSTNVIRVLRNIWDNLPLDDTTKKIIGIVAVAGPVVLVIGKIVTAAGTLVSSIGAIQGALTLLGANPVMLWILGGTLAIAAIVGITTAITNATSSAGQLRQTLANIDMTISEEAQSNISAGIEKGIEIANKTYAVDVKVDAEISDITTKVENAFQPFINAANEKFTGQNAIDLKTNVETFAGGAIDQLKTTISTRVSEVEAEMDRLGQSAEVKESAVAEVQSKGNTAIGQLETYRANAVAILEAITAADGKVTKQQLIDFQKSLDGIKAIGQEWGIVLDTSSLVSELETAWSALVNVPKNKMSKKEITALKTSVREYVGSAIDEVKDVTKAKATEVSAAFDALGISGAAKDSAVANVKAQGDKAITDLQTYETAATNLLTEMGKAGTNVTQDQLDAFAELMNQIGIIKKEIGLAQESVDGYIVALRDRISRGVASDEEVAIVVQFDAQYSELHTQTVREQFEADMTAFGVALQSATEENKPEIQMQMDLRTEQLQQDLAGVKTQATTDIASTWNALIASTEEGKTALDSAVQAANLIATVEQMFQLPEGFSSLSDEMKAEVTAMLIGAVPHLTAEQINAPMAPVAIYALEAVEAVNKNITTGAKAIEENETLKNALNTMLQSGALDGVDVSTLPATLKGALVATNFKDSGGVIGTDIMAGLGLGIINNSSVPEKDMTTAGQSVIEAAKKVFQINSPSKVFEEIGTGNMEGLDVGHTKGAATVESNLTKLAGTMWSGVQTAFDTQVAAIVTSVDTAFSKMPDAINVHTVKIATNVTLWGSEMSSKSKSIGEDFVTKMDTPVATLVDKIKLTTNTIYTNVTTWGANMVTKAKSIGDDIVLKVTTPVNTLPGLIEVQTDLITTNLNTWGIDVGKKGADAGDALTTKTEMAANKLLPKMVTIGEQVITGFWMGIDNKTEWLEKQLSTLVDKITAKIKKEFKIKSPSGRMADEVGDQLPPGIAVGFERSLPVALNTMQDALDDGMNGFETTSIDMSIAANVGSFADKLMEIYDKVGYWFESVEMRMIASINNMSSVLLSFAQKSNILVGSSGMMSYVPSGAFGQVMKHEWQNTPVPAGSSQGEGDTFNFYSNAAISEVEAARLLKQSKRDMAEGFK